MVMIGHFDRALMFPWSESLKRAFESLLVLAIDKGVYVVAFRTLLYGIRPFKGRHPQPQTGMSQSGTGKRQALFRPGHESTSPRGDGRLWRDRGFTAFLAGVQAPELG